MDTEFHNFLKLPDHIQVKIMKNCDSVRTMLNLSETCLHLHRLLLKTPHLINQLKLVVKFTRDEIEVIDKLTTLLKNASIGRRYCKMKLVSVDEVMKDRKAILLIKICKIVGRSVKELNITSGNFSLQNLVDLLKCFENVEKLTVNNVQVNLNTNLVNGECEFPNLNELRLHRSRSTIMRLFENVTTLSCFKFHCQNRGSDMFNYGIKNFEDFLLQQHGLTVLDISHMNKHCLFQSNRLDEIRFQLKTLIVNGCFLHKTNATGFFRHQRGLKTVKLFDFFDSRIFPDTADYSSVLNAIFTLPQLETVAIFNQTISLYDFYFLNGISNTSVSNLEYDMWNATILERLIEIFPNLKKLSLRCFAVKLRNVPCNKLKIMQTSGSYNLEEFSYQPPIVESYNETFESCLFKFLIHHKSIKHLTIGSSSWVHINFGLSLNFWIEVLFHLKELGQLVVFQSFNVKRLVMILGCKNSLRSVTIYTNLTEKKSTQEIEQSWLNVVVV